MSRSYLQQRRIIHEKRFARFVIVLMCIGTVIMVVSIGLMCGVSHGR